MWAWSPLGPWKVISGSRARRKTAQIWPACQGSRAAAPLQKPPKPLTLWPQAVKAANVGKAPVYFSLQAEMGATLFY
jgi:hypothetical protein